MIYNGIRSMFTTNVTIKTPIQDETRPNKRRVSNTVPAYWENYSRIFLVSPTSMSTAFLSSLPAA